MDIQNNSIVTDADTEVLDSQITQISNDFAETYYFDSEQEEELELLVAKAMKLGELYERKKWQAAKAQAVQEWINVDDRLPPVDETVLVCWDYAPDIEPEKEYTTIDENLDEYWPNCQDEPPTHWMPLPKVVKAQEPADD